MDELWRCCQKMSSRAPTSHLRVALRLLGLLPQVVLLRNVLRHVEAARVASGREGVAVKGGPSIGHGCTHVHLVADVGLQKWVYIHS
jgi:hypothetical protein